MSEAFAGEFVGARYVEDGPGRLGRVRWREPVVRCADCALAKDAASGLVCTLRGAAGWFATEPEGFCHRGARAGGGE